MEGAVSSEHVRRRGLGDRGAEEPELSRSPVNGAEERLHTGIAPQGFGMPTQGGLADHRGTRYPTGPNTRLFLVAVDSFVRPPSVACFPPSSADASLKHQQRHSAAVQVECACRRDSKG